MGNKLDEHEIVSKLKILALELDKTPTIKEFSSVVSKRQIQKYGHANLCRKAGLDVNKHSSTTEPVEVVIRPPRILFLDIETAPITAHVWQLFDVNVGLNQIVSDWFVMSYAAKFANEETIHYLDQRYSPELSDDEQLLCGIHHLLSEADWICGHNIARFDLKKLNARFVKHGLAPLHHFTVIDTLRICKRNFALTSNKLSYIADYLKCEHSKLTHKSFSGHELWSECLKRNIDAWNEMEAYNKMDVIVLEEVFNKIAAWDTTLNPQSFYQKPVCLCGNEKFFKDGFRHTRQGRFQIYRCSNKKCSKTFTSKTNEIDKDIRKEWFK